MQYSRITTPTFSLLSTVLISDFRRGVVEVVVLPGVTQRRLVDSYRRFVTTYQFHFEWVHQSENVDRYNNSAISVAQWTFLAIALYRIVFPPYICSYLVFYLIPQVSSYPAPLQRWVSFLENLSVPVPFFDFPLCAIRSNWYIFGFTQGETEEVAWRVEPQTVQSCLSHGAQET